MSVKFMRKTAVAVAATALLGGGLAVGVGQGVAGAEGSLGSSEGGTADCRPSATKDLKMGLTDRSLTVTQSVTSEVAAGRTVTVETTVAGDGAIVGVKRLRDNVPAGFELQSMTVNGKNVFDRAKASSAEGTAYVDASSDVEWVTTKSSPVRLRSTYKVPSNAKVGEKFNVGTGLSVALGGKNDWNFKESGACFSIRMPNAVEGAYGSLDAAGLGSVEGGIDGMTGSFEDPQGAISDIIGGIIGKAIRDGLGS